MEEIKNSNEKLELNYIDKIATGKNIRRLCEEYGISRKYLAAILGLTSIQSVDHYFSGHNLPSTEGLLIMSTLFNISIEDILILKGDIEGYNRATLMEIDEENSTIDNTLFFTFSKREAITTFRQLGDIWYDIPEVIRNDIMKRIFDCLLDGNSQKNDYIQHQFQNAYKYSMMDDKQKEFFETDIKNSKQNYIKALENKF